MTELGEGSQQPTSEFGEGDITPTAERTEPISTRPTEFKSKATVHDSVIEVVLSSANISAKCFASGAPRSVGRHSFAKMIISVWEIDDEKYFTLTFTNTDSSQTSLPSSRGQSRQVTRTAKHHLGSSSTGSGSGSGSGSGPLSSPGSVSSGNSSSRGGSCESSAITSPTSASMSASPFPPLGPPSRTNTADSGPSNLQKIILMKDALLDTTTMPILSMWKDESLSIPNKAARRLFHPTADFSNVKDGFDLVSKWHVWDETFTTRLVSNTASCVV
jgi:hypothetical protein